MVRSSQWNRLTLAALAAAGLVAWGQHDARRARMVVMPPFVPPADAAEFAPDRVLVKLTVELDPAEVDLRVAPWGGRFLQRGVDGAFDVLKVPAGSVREWVNLLSTQADVEYAEPDYVAWMSGAPNDTYYNPYQWNFFNWGQTSNGVVSNHGVQGDAAWNTTQGAGVTVAVVDTGVAYETYGAFTQASDLAGTTFVAGWDYVNNDSHPNDDNGHGTHVAGTVAQTTNNSAGCAGLAYAASIMPIKVLDSSGSGLHSWIADGIRYAANNGAFVINLSLGSRSGSSTMLSAIDYAWSTKGCVTCAATGNAGKNGIDYPARYANTIAVGATRFDGARCNYSNWGTGIDIVAPGGDTGVDQNNDGYGDGILQQTFSGGYSNFGYYFFAGTSMATPHVAATAALVRANKSTYTNNQVRSAIQTKAKDLGAGGYDTKYGNGLVSAKDALTY